MITFGHQVVHDRYVTSLRAPLTVVSLILFVQMIFWLGEEQRAITKTNGASQKRRLQGISNVNDPKTIIEKSEQINLPWNNNDDDDSSSIDLIVNLCKEPIDPISDLAHQLQVNRVFIYSKCGQKLSSEDLLSKKEGGTFTVHFQQLRNVGKESHTWLHHMLRTKDKSSSSDESSDEELFADWNLFLQANHHASMETILSGYQHMQKLLLDDNKKNINFVDLSQYHFSPCARSVILDKSSQILSPQPHVREYDRFWCPWHQQYITAGEEKDCSTAKISLLGEFWASRDLLLQQSSERLQELKTKFETTKTFQQESDSVRFGYFMERWWINILNATDSCSSNAV